MAVSELQVPQITLSSKSLSSSVGVLLPCPERWVLLLATAHPRDVPVDPRDGHPVPKPAWNSLSCRSSQTAAPSRSSGGNQRGGKGLSGDRYGETGSTGLC